MFVRQLDFHYFLTLGCQRQFERLIEMLALRKLDPTDEGALRAFRLQVKERLYRFNFVSNAYDDRPQGLIKGQGNIGNSGRERAEREA